MRILNVLNVLNVILVVVLSALMLSSWACGDSGSAGRIDAATADGSAPSDGTVDPDSAADAETPDPYPHLARVPVPDSIIPLPDGTYDLPTGWEVLDIAQAFYARWPDDFDVLIVWTDFEIADIWAFTLPTRIDIAGIGQDEVMELYGWGTLGTTFTDQAGSAGRLQAICLMNSPELYQMGGRFSAQDLIAHEVGHRWSANLSLPWLADRWILTDASYSHWAIVADAGGLSATGYGGLTDLGGGQFQYDIVTPLRYSNLELYQMGLISSAQVGTLYYVASATNFNPPTQFGNPVTADTYGMDVTFDGTRVDFTMGDVIAAHGARVPDHTAAQTAFKMAFVVVCPQAAQCSAQGLSWVDIERQAWETTFLEATGQRGTADTRLF